MNQKYRVKCYGTRTFFYQLLKIVKLIKKLVYRSELPDNSFIDFQTGEC